MKRKKQLIANLLVASCLLFPALALAETIGGVIGKVQGVITAIITVIFGLAFIVFLWGVFKYIRAADEGGKEESRNLIIYGIIGLFVMLAAWGLVNVLINTFNLDSATPTALPTIPGF